MSQMRRVGGLASAFVVLCSLVAVFPSSARAATTNIDPAVAYQINISHSGGQSKDALRVHPQIQWTRQFEGAVSYPIIADGKVFVTVAGGARGHGTTLFALSQKTGKRAWGEDLGGTYWWSALAYDNGSVFALNDRGVLASFSSARGTIQWSEQLPGQYLFSSPPTAANGVVYAGGAGSGGTVYAVSEATGGILWTASVENGDDSSPAVTSSGIFVSYACNQTYALDPTTGALLWHYSGPCAGGGGATVAVNAGRVYTRDFFGDLILDAGSGALLGTYTATTIPAFDVNGHGYFLSDGVLSAVDLSTEQTLWQFTGDGQLDSAPIVVNDQIIVGSASGSLYALDPQGTVVWSTLLQSGINAPDERNLSAPLTGLAAGNGSLIVPAGNLLVAFS
jgi:outer membrane protein assembly factor BamB